MLADPKAEALISNFAGQYLYLRNLRNKVPNSFQFPDFDDDLRRAMVREVELFFKSVMDEDRNVLDLMTADFTYVNERLAKHYGMPDIYGSQFRRVTVSDARRGLLGKGAILMATSHAHRTSPVLRGKWVLENIIGVSPAPPPDVVPALDEIERPDKPRSVRESLEQHRANPSCASCHRVLDPIGFALENFDAVGAWRTRDGGTLGDAGRRVRSTGRRHEARRRRGAAPGAGARAGDVRQDLHRKTADVCGGTRTNCRGPAGGAVGRQERARKQLPVFFAGARHRPQRAVPDAHRGRSGYSQCE